MQIGRHIIQLRNSMLQIPHRQAHINSPQELKNLIAGQCLRVLRIREEDLHAERGVLAHRPLRELKDKVDVVRWEVLQVSDCALGAVELGRGFDF